ncbi:Dyp-type peroxidase [Georgenia alba]|uniref:Dyp-type peroxidase n=1 Tax=Georgenia alba TaxID=2233858 RepID=A0ABW2Q7C6_9MICO
MSGEPAGRPSRRGVLLGAGGLVGGAAGGFLLGREAAPATSPAPARPGRPEPVTAAGRTQAGVARPGTPQAHGLLAVHDMDPAPGALGERLARLGEAILDLTAAAPGHPHLPDGAGDLTVTVGLGPALVSAVDPGLPGAEDLPGFAGEDSLDRRHRGGDLLLALHASDPTVLPPALAALRAHLGEDVAPRWTQACWRGPGEGTISRNPLGHLDGVVVPRGAEELDRHVWLDGPLAGGTVCVVRRLRLDLEGFGTLDGPAQDAVIGRRRRDGTPLSGGSPSDDVDLSARTPEGQYLVPTGSHVRAAHPSFTGSELMLRRSYTFAEPDGAGAGGLLFVCFQRSLGTFVRTQQRLDESDELMRYVTPTASGTFLVLPGFDPGRPLGAPLVGP